MTELSEFLRTMGPVFAGVWVVTILCALLRPQRYLNSFLLLGALLVTLVFVAGLFGDRVGPWVLLAGFLLILLGLLLTPVLLILNGIQLIRREGFSPAHVLSLALGVVVGLGELAAVAYVLGLRDFSGLGRPEPWFLAITFTVFYFSSLVLSFVIYTVFIQIMPHRMNFDYVIIHGCGLAGGERMTKLLSNRVDKAIQIWRKCRRKPILIPSGGRGDDEKLSEAEAMKRYLLEHGIPEECILPEDRSKTTRENLLYSKEIIDARPGRKRTALVSSNYHVYRCLRLAREAGLKCTGIGADVALYYWPSALIREFIAIFLTRRFLIWSLLGYAVFIGPILYVLIAG